MTIIVEPFFGTDGIFMQATITTTQFNVPILYSDIIITVTIYDIVYNFIFIIQHYMF